MNVTDGIAVGLLLWTAAVTFCRGEMLRGRLDPRPDLARRTYAGNWPMIIGLDFAALGLIGWAIEIWRNQPELGLGALAAIVGCAGGSTTVLASMIGHNWREAARRRERSTRIEDVADMKTAVAETLPPVVERSLEKVTEGFMRPAPDHDRLIRVEPLRPSAN